MLTVLDKRGSYVSVASAAAAPSKASGLVQSDIEEHRKAIGRGKRDQATTEGYYKALAQIAEWSNEGLLKSATFLHQFVILARSFYTRLAAIPDPASAHVGVDNGYKEVSPMGPQLAAELGART